MAAKSESKKLTPEAQLRAYIDRLDPKTQKLFRSVRSAVRKRLPACSGLRASSAGIMEFALVYIIDVTKEKLKRVRTIYEIVVTFLLHLIDWPVGPDEKRNRNPSPRALPWAG